MEDKELIERLRELDCASIADTDKSIAVMDPGLHPVRENSKMVGVARTVRCDEDFLAVIEALSVATAGEVLVVDTQGSTRAVVGELFSIEAERIGLSGIIVDGPIRDIETIRTLSMPVFARSYCPVSGTTQNMGEQQITVNCGGLRVKPGDIVMADDDGILVAKAATFAAKIEQAKTIQKLEIEVRRRMAQGQSLLDMLNAEQHLNARRRDEPSSLSFSLDDAAD